MRVTSCKIVLICTFSGKYVFYDRISILPEVEEFLVILYGFGCIAFLFVDFAEPATFAKLSGILK